MNWQIIVDPFVRKRLKRIPKKDREQIVAAFRELAVNPHAGDIEKMKGEDGIWRQRTGSYRIFYNIRNEQKMIYVFEVERRTSKTY